MSTTATERVTCLDGLRGFLAAYVMIAHLANAFGQGRLIGAANVSVTIFFVISGYVLTRAWNGHYLAFLARRVVRLWPVYALAIAVGGYLCGSFAPASLYLWFPLMGVHAQPAQNPAAWSLFIEAWAMPLMPLIVWIGRRPVWTAAAMLALFAAKGYNEDVYYGLYFIAGSYFARATIRSRFLESAFPQWLGRISYSLYLSHLLVIAVLKFYLPGVALYLAIPACLVVAQVVCLAVERPSILLSRRVGRWVESALGQDSGRAGVVVAS